MEKSDGQKSEDAEVQTAFQNIGKKHPENSPNGKVSVCRFAV